MAKAQAAPKPPAPNPLAPMIDELGALERELAPYEAKASRAELLRKTIRAHYEAEPAAQEFQPAGARFIALVGAKAEKRSIDFRALAKAIGLKAYAAFATCTLAALEANAPCQIAAQVVSSERTGYRPLKIVERGAAA